jgi:hypothetical protein
MTLLAASVALGASLISGLCLLALHGLSTEFAPSWRMVSEYAGGAHPRWLAAVFLFWALSSVALMLAIAPLVSGPLAIAGLVLLALAALGQAMGGIFDITHKLHGPAAMIGIPALCAAAVVLQVVLVRLDLPMPPTFVAHLPWISFALMAVATVLFFSGLKAAGVEMSPDAAPLKTLPDGVHGFLGWANRAIFVSSYLWSGWTALALIRGN